MFENQTVGKNLVWESFDDEGNAVLVEDYSKVVVSTDPLITVTNDTQHLVWIYNWNTEEGMWLDRNTLLGAIL